MMAFLSFLLLAGIAYLIWRISDQLPDVIFRVSEIQRDVAEIRRNLNGSPDTSDAPAPATASSTVEPADDSDTTPTSS